MKPVKVTLLGAGSGFTKPLFTDILLIKEIEKGVIGLVDIDSKRLEVNIKLISRIIELLDRKGWTIEASTDRRKIMPGTDYLISTIEVSGTQCVTHDNNIPLKYGIDQCIGDTIGPGGIMKALRTLPAFLEILDDAKKYCPGALIMNYTNPMSIMTLGALRTTRQPFVGLCHSVQGSSAHMASVAGVPLAEMQWKCAGINHMAWFTELTWKGHDLYPVILENIKTKSVYERDPVRFEMMKEFGYFVTESSGHFSEYVPYFRKRRDLIKKYCREGYLGGSSFYSKNWPKWRKDTDKLRLQMAQGRKEIDLKRGHEFAADIVEAHVFNKPKTIHASVLNTGLIPNLPLNGVVEVATLVDRNGFTPTYFGSLPEQVAALCRSNMAVYELCASGILNKDRESVINAMMLDPLSSAVCCPAEIRRMAEEMFRAEKDFIPGWVNKAAGKPVSTTKVRALIRASNSRAARASADGAAGVSEMAARNVSKGRRKK